MSIYYERREWEPMQAYYFRSTFDFKDICVVTNQGDCWELLFYKGSANPGPFYYANFAKAKRHVFRYLEPREERLTGGPGRMVICGGNSSLPPPGLHTVHPSRRPRRKNWVHQSGE